MSLATTRHPIRSIAAQGMLAVVVVLVLTLVLAAGVGAKPPEIVSIRSLAAVDSSNHSRHTIASGDTALMTWKVKHRARNFEVRYAAISCKLRQVPTKPPKNAHGPRTPLTGRSLSKHSYSTTRLYGPRCYAWWVRATDSATEQITSWRPSHFVVGGPSIPAPTRLQPTGRLAYATRKNLCWSGVSGGRGYAAVTGYVVTFNGRKSSLTKSTCSGSQSVSGGKSYRWSVAALVRAAGPLSGPTAASTFFIRQPTATPSPTVAPTVVPVLPTSVPVVATSVPQVNYSQPTVAPPIVPTVAPTLQPKGVGKIPCEFNC